MKKTLIIIGIGLLFCNFNHKVFATKEETTIGDLIFIENNDSILPLSPDNKEEIVPEQLPTAGPLSLSYVPNLFFGTQEVCANQLNLQALPTEITTKKQSKKKVLNFIQLNDYRGTLSGWKLTIKSELPLINENKIEVKGASLEFSKPKIESLNELGKEYTPSLIHSKIKLLIGAGETQTLVTAKEGEGAGSWHIILDQLANSDKKIYLNLPANSIKEGGLYQTKLKWILEDTL